MVLKHWKLGNAQPPPPPVDERILNYFKVLVEKYDNGGIEELFFYYTKNIIQKVNNNAP